MHLSIHLSVCLSIHPSIYLSIRQSMHPSMDLYIYIYIYIYILINTGETFYLSPQVNCISFLQLQRPVVKGSSQLTVCSYSTEGTTGPLRSTAVNWELSQRVPKISKTTFYRLLFYFLICFNCKSVGRFLNNKVYRR